MGNVIGRKIKAGKDPRGLGSWTLAQFRGQADATMKICTLQLPVLPDQGGVTGSVYAKQLT